MTPDRVHYGQTDAIYAARQNTLEHAFRNNPQHFVNKAPTPPDKPTAAWINLPASTLKIQADPGCIRVVHTFRILDLLCPGGTMVLDPNWLEPLFGFKRTPPGTAPLGYVR